MSLFQCENCGCVENTALSAQGFICWPECFCWDGKEHLRGKQICSACGPAHFREGKPTEYGKWHDVFPRVYLPKGMFKTNKVGNLEHIETGETDYRKYEIRTE